MTALNENYIHFVWILLVSASDEILFLLLPGAWEVTPQRQASLVAYIKPFVASSIFPSKTVLICSHYKVQRIRTTVFENLQCS